VIRSAERIQRYTEEIPEVSQGVGAKFLEPVSKSIIFEGVTYQQDGKTLLNNVDLRITAETKTAIVAHRPSDALALAYLLPRFIEPLKGRVLFDSQDIAWGTLESLRAEAIFVGGDDLYFTGTILENLTCGETRYSLQDVTAAAKQAHAHKFISAFSNGYETVLGEHGEQLDAGQSFRLGLARAVLRSPAVLIIQEPAQPLDTDTKSLIDDAYQRILTGRTVLFLPTRLTTLKQCDQVVLLDEGKVSCVGKQPELVRKHEGYIHWEYVHFSPQSRKQQGTL